MRFFIFCKEFTLFLINQKTLFLNVNKKSLFLHVAGGERLANVITFVLVVGQTVADEVLRLLGHQRLDGEVHLAGLQDHLFLQQLVLGHVVAEGLACVEHLEENDSDGPHVDFGGNLRRVVFADVEALGRQVPIGPNCKRYPAPWFVSSILVISSFSMVLQRPKSAILSIP
jgi:hypothetical protein